MILKQVQILKYRWNFLSHPIWYLCSYLHELTFLHINSCADLLVLDKSIFRFLCHYRLTIGQTYHLYCDLLFNFGFLSISSPHDHCLSYIIEFTFQIIILKLDLNTINQYIESMESRYTHVYLLESMFVLYLLYFIFIYAPLLFF